VWAGRGVAEKERRRRRLQFGRKATMCAPGRYGGISRRRINRKIEPDTNVDDTLQRELQLLTFAVSEKLRSEVSAHGDGVM